MGLFGRRITYDRTRLLRQAEAASGAGRWRRALRLYRQLLAAEPRNPELHFKIAPLLARGRHHFEAWESFRIAIEATEIADDAIGARTIHRRAVEALPRSFDAWRGLARAELRCDGREKALEALRKGRLQMRGRGRRNQAIALLREARELDPWEPEIVLDLCRLLARKHQRAEASFLLEGLDRRARGDALKQARALAWRLDPTLEHTWKWIQSIREVRRSDLRLNRA